MLFRGGRPLVGLWPHSLFLGQGPRAEGWGQETEWEQKTSRWEKGVEYRVEASA